MAKTSTDRKVSAWSIHTPEHTQPSQRAGENASVSSMDGVRDDRTKRSQGERPRTGESHHFIPVNSFTNRLTDLGNQLMIIKGKREEKGDVKRLGLTDTFLILLLAQGNLPNTLS